VGEPFLRLAAIAAAPRPAAERGRQVVGQPLRRLGEEAHGGYVRLLAEFAPCRALGRLALVDPTLGELPVVPAGPAGHVLRVVAGDPPADEGVSGGVQHQDSDARPVWQAVRRPGRRPVGWPGHRLTADATGTSAMPRASSWEAQSAIRATESGRAEA